MCSCDSEDVDGSDDANNGDGGRCGGGGDSDGEGEGHSDGGSDIAAPESHNTPPRQLPLLCKAAKFAFKAVAHISRDN